MAKGQNVMSRPTEHNAYVLLAHKGTLCSPVSLWCVSTMRTAQMMKPVTDSTEYVDLSVKVTHVPIRLFALAGTINRSVFVLLEQRAMHTSSALVCGWIYCLLIESSLLSPVNLVLLYLIPKFHIYTSPCCDYTYSYSIYITSLKNFQDFF